MAGFDVAVGMHESQLNDILSQVYNALHSTLLTGNIAVGKAGISSVDFDFKVSPTISLQASDEAKQHIKTAITNLMASESDMSALEEMVSVVTFTASFSDVSLKINNDNNSKPTTIPSASLVAHACITVDGDDSDLSINILRAAVNVPNNEILNHLLNNAFVPYILDYLNTKILDPINIPPIGFKSLQISTPLPVVQNSYLTAFSSLGKTPSTIPVPWSWPTDGVYIALDIPALEAASRIIFPLGPQDNFDWMIFSGHVGATVNAPVITSINGDGSISATIEANACCQLIMKTPWPLPDVTFGPGATAQLACTLRPIVEDREVKIVVEGIPIPAFKFDWGIPSVVNWLFYPLEAGLAAALNAILGPLIGDALKFPGIPVYSLPDNNLDFGRGAKIKIRIDEAEPSGLNGNLVLTAQATVSKQ